MKKRLISFLLALSMMLSLVPAGAFAASVQNLAISQDTHRPEGPGGGNSGWSYDEDTDTLTLYENYSMANNSSYPYIACKVVNRGTIKGAIYTNTVTSENGSFQFGIYLSKPTGTFASGSKEFYTISSSDGTTAFDLNRKLYNITAAYSVNEQAVTVNAPEGKVVSKIEGASSGWGGVTGLGEDTATFTMAEQDVTITFANKPGYTEPTDKIELVIDDNGFPKGTENGTKDVYNGDGWSFQTTTLANGNNEKALVLNKEFDLTGKTLNVPVVVNGVSIEGGTYNEHVETRGKKWITNATFNSTLVNSADVVPGSLSFGSATADCYHLTDCTFNGAVTNNGCIADGTFNAPVTNNNWIEFSLFKTSEVTSDLTTSVTFRFCVFTEAVTNFPKCVLGSSNGGQLFLSADKPTFVDSSVEVYHIDAANVAQPSVLGTNAYTAPLVQLEASRAWATAGTEVSVKPASGTVDNINSIALRDYDRFAIDSPTEKGFYRFTPHSDVVLNQSGLGLTFEAYRDYLYPKGTEHGQYAITNGNGWKYENKTLTITDPNITLAETGTFPASYRITTSGAITSGTFKGSVTTTGAITGGTFEGSVTTTGDVRGGLFLGGFTSANAPTGGIFAQRNDADLNLRKVSIQGGSKFTIPVNGVAHEFTEVYIPDQTTITLTAATSLARMNGEDIPAAQLSNGGKTVKITANGEDIVLDKALAAPTKDLFNVYAQDVIYDGDPHGARVYAKIANDLPGVDAGPITADFTVKYRLAGEGSAFTTTAPTNAGTYEVAVTFPADGNYKGAEDLVVGQFTIDKKTITAEDFTFSAPDSLTYDGNAKAATVQSADEENPVATSFTVQYTDAAGTVVDEPTNAGTYKVVLDITPDSNHKLEGNSPLTSDRWTFEIAKAELTANDFEMVGEGENRTIQPKAGHDGVTVDEIKWLPVESIATLSLDLDEMDSGKYQAYITVSAEEDSNYTAPAGQLTSEDWTLDIGKRTLTAADFTIEKPTYPHDRFDGSPKEVQPTYNGTVTIGDITVKYEKQNDAGEWEPIEGAPVETGTYRFTLDVAESPNNNPATGLRGDNWQFTIAEPLYHVYVEGGSAYYFDATRRQIDIINGETLVPAKVTVYLVADADETADTDTEIALLTLDAEDEGTVDDFQWYIDPRTGSNLTEIINPTSRTDASFVMPRGDVYITTTNPNPEPEIVDSGAGTAVAVVLGGAAIGGVAYLAGTQLYLESVLPKGAAIPVNRQQLADLLWTTAGKPQPQSSVLFTDISAEAIDSQKAARWCVEQGLMPADGTSFKPSRYTFRLQVIKTWNDLQAMQKAG